MTDAPEITIYNAPEGLTVTKGAIFLVGIVGKYPEQEKRYKTGEGKKGVWHLISFQIPIFDNLTKTVYYKCVGWRSVATANQDLAEGDFVRCEISKIERKEWEGKISPQFEIHQLEVGGRAAPAQDELPLQQPPMDTGNFGDGTHTKPSDIPEMSPDAPPTDDEPFL